MIQTLRSGMLMMTFALICMTGCSSVNHSDTSNTDIFSKREIDTETVPQTTQSESFSYDDIAQLSGFHIVSAEWDAENDTGSTYKHFKVVVSNESGQDLDEIGLDYAVEDKDGNILDDTFASLNVGLPNGKQGTLKGLVKIENGTYRINPQYFLISVHYTQAHIKLDADDTEKATLEINSASGNSEKVVLDEHDETLLGNDLEKPGDYFSEYPSLMTPESGIDYKYIVNMGTKDNGNNTHTYYYYATNSSDLAKIYYEVYKNNVVPKSGLTISSIDETTDSLIDPSGDTIGVISLMDSAAGDYFITVILDA